MDNYNIDNKIPDQAIIFEAEIIESKVKKLVSGDKGLRLIIDVNAYPGLAGKIDDIWITDETMQIAIYRGNG